MESHISYSPSSAQNPGMSQIGSVRETKGPSGSSSGTRGTPWGKILLLMLVVVGGAVTSVILMDKPKTLKAAPASEGSDLQKSGSKQEVVADVISPTPGGKELVITQPGSVLTLNGAVLYAKVSGYLEMQNVDIGSMVNKNDLLAKIYLPEAEAQVKKDKADVDHAQAHVEQMKAYVQTAIAESKAKSAMINLAKATLKSREFYQEFRKKMLDRIIELVKKNAIEAKLQDEEQDHFDSAFEAVIAAKEGVVKAELDYEASNYKILQAKADVKDAEAQLEVAKSQLAKSEVMLKYTEIRSPYKGVITMRNFLVGDFVTAATESGAKPLLSVEDPDKMRMVVEIPDDSVGYITDKCKAEFTFPGLGSEVFKANFSRSAKSQDIDTRRMRIEFDIDSYGGRIKRGMYCNARVIAREKNQSAFTIPSEALFDKSGGTKAKVRVVRDGVVHVVDIEIPEGGDTGNTVEVIKGLNATDQVIVHVSAPVAEGTAVKMKKVSSSVGKDLHR